MQLSIQLHSLNAHIKLHVKQIGSLSFSLRLSSKKEKKEKKVKDAFSFVESLCFVAIFSKPP
jgi:hypothetical protein